MIKPRNLAVLMQRHADLISTARHDPSRFACFVSYHDADFSEVESFIAHFGEEFLPRCIGVTEQDGFIGSLDEQYIQSCVREEILGDTVVTIILLGRETWHQRFVDWEIAASLRPGRAGLRNGVLVMPLPSMRNRAILPERIRDNFFGIGDEKSSVIYEAYPASQESFRAKLDRAYASRSGPEANDDRPLRRTDSP